MSKSISATCVAKAVTDKVVSWSDPVTKYLPTFTLADPAVTRMATIGDFFSHRTGLPGAAGDDLEGFGFDRDQVLSRLHLFPLNPYRISYGYSNFGMTTGGEAVATAAGTPWDQLCAKELFTPAKMTTASYSYQNFLQQPNRATIHVEVDGAYKPLYQRDADPQAPAGGRRRLSRIRAEYRRRAQLVTKGRVNCWAQVLSTGCVGLRRKAPAICAAHADLP